MSNSRTFGRGAGVAAALLGMTTIAGCGGATGADEAAESTRSPQVLGAAVLDLDVGPLADPTPPEDCLLPGFGPDTGSPEVLYAVEQRTAEGTSPVLVLRNAEGEVGLCDATGPDRPAAVPLPTPTDAEPLVFLANGQSSWDCEDTRLQGYTRTTWLAVGDGVAAVQQRYVVDGAPEPWFTTAPRDGYAHLQTWVEGPLPTSAEILVEHRVLDASGKKVAQSALPTEGEPLETCTESGDVQIG